MNTEDLQYKLSTAFNDIKYYDNPHKYFLNNKELTSVTTLIHNYQEPFDEEYWSQYKANEHSIPQYKIKRAWNFINKKGTIKGSLIHDYSENLFLNKKFDYDKDGIMKEFGFDPVYKEYEITKKHVDNFYNDVKGKLIPIKLEYIIYDEESLIAGMLDSLFFNVRANEFQIWDNKTNKDFTFENKNKFLLNELGLLEDCDLEIYSLQLGLYKYILQKTIGISLGKSYVVWFSHRNVNYKVIEMNDRSYYINLMVKSRINNNPN